MIFTSLFFTLDSSCAASCSVIIQNNNGWPEKNLLSSVFATITWHALMFIPHVCKGQLQNNHLPAPGDLSVPCLTSPRADFQSKAFLARAVWKVDQIEQGKWIWHCRPLIVHCFIDDRCTGNPLLSELVFALVYIRFLSLFF